MTEIDRWRTRKINEIVDRFIERDHYGDEETARWAMFAMGQVSMVMTFPDAVVEEKIRQEADLELHMARPGWAPVFDAVRRADGKG